MRRHFARDWSRRTRRECTTGHSHIEHYFRFSTSQIVPIHKSANPTEFLQLNLGICNVLPGRILMQLGNQSFERLLKMPLFPWLDIQAAGLTSAGVQRACARGTPVDASRDYRPSGCLPHKPIWYPPYESPASLRTSDIFGAKPRY